MYLYLRLPLLSCSMKKSFLKALRHQRGRKSTGNIENKDLNWENNTEIREWWGHHQCLNTLQFSSVVQLCLTLCNPMDCNTPGFSVHHQLLEFTQTHIHWVGGDAIQPSHPLSSPSPPAFSLSQNRGLFQWVSSSHQVAKVWSFSFSISLYNEYSGLISFRTDWLDLLAVQGTLKSLNLLLFYIHGFSQPGAVERCSVHCWEAHTYKGAHAPQGSLVILII